MEIPKDAECPCGATATVAHIVQGGEGLQICYVCPTCSDRAREAAALTTKLLGWYAVAPTLRPKNWKD